MVLMLVYVEMAEDLVKPLVILPAAVMPLTFLSLSSHNIIIPFCEHASCYALTNCPRVHTGTLDVLAGSYLQRV